MRGITLITVLALIAIACGDEGVGVRDARPVEFGEATEHLLLPAEPIAMHVAGDDYLVVVFAESPWLRMIPLDGAGGFLADQHADFDLLRAMPDDLELTPIDAVVFNYSGDDDADLAVLDSATGRTYLFKRVGEVFEYRHWNPPPADGSRAVALSADQMNRGGTIDFAVATQSDAFLYFHEERRPRWRMDDRGVALGPDVVAMATGDFVLNGSVGIASAGSEGIRHSRRNTRGMFVPDERFSIDVTGVTDLATGDINADQMLDLAVARRAANEIQIWFTDIDREWTPNSPPSVSVSAPVEVLAHDMDGDGRLDLIVASGAEAAGAVQILVVPQQP